MKRPWFAPPFQPPRLVEGDGFSLRPLTVRDAVQDFAAVMGSREALWALFGEGWHWPPEDLSLEADLVDLAWHQKEFELGTSFAWTVAARHESRLLGCAYLFPARLPDWEADAFFWVASDVRQRLEAPVEAAFRTLLAAFPLQRIAWPGRALPWHLWNSAP
jgi:hypothetical protein